MDIAGNRTLSSIFSQFAAYHPDKTYLIFEDLDGHCQQWSFAQFDVQVNQTAAWLLEIGIKRGESFAFHAPNSPVFVALAIAASRIGAVMVPTDHRATVDELVYILDHSESRLVVTEFDQLTVSQAAASATSCVQEVVVSRCEHPCGHPIFEREIARQDLAPPNVETSPDDVVHMIYTSGTTSKPKGVLMTNRALIYGAEVFVRGSGLRNEDRHLITLPVFHAAAHCHAFWPSLVCGASIVVSPRFSPSRFFGLAVRHQCTMAALFSAPLRMLLTQPPNEGWRSHRLRNITFAIALTEEQFAEWDTRLRRTPPAPMGDDRNGWIAADESTLRPAQPTLNGKTCPWLRCANPRRRWQPNASGRDWRDCNRSGSWAYRNERVFQESAGDE